MPTFEKCSPDASEIQQFKNALASLNTFNWFDWQLENTAKLLIPLEPSLGSLNQLFKSYTIGFSTLPTWPLLLVSEGELFSNDKSLFCLINQFWYKLSLQVKKTLFYKRFLIKIKLLSLEALVNYLSKFSQINYEQYVNVIIMFCNCWTIARYRIACYVTRNNLKRGVYSRVS